MKRGVEGEGVKRGVKRGVEGEVLVGGRVNPCDPEACGAGDEEEFSQALELFVEGVNGRDLGETVWADK